MFTCSIRKPVQIFQIKLPSEARITLTTTLKNKYLNVYIHPSVLDYNKIDGLCGNFDGDKTNDYQLGISGRKAKDNNELSAFWR